MSVSAYSYGGFVRGSQIVPTTDAGNTMGPLWSMNLGSLVQPSREMLLHCDWHGMGSHIQSQAGCILTIQDPTPATRAICLEHFQAFVKHLPLINVLQYVCHTRRRTRECQ